MYKEALAISVRRERSDAPVIASAKGCYLIDTTGKPYLDMTGGSGAVNLGHQHPDIVEAIREQSGRVIHTGWNIDNPLRHQVIEKLAHLLPFTEARVMGAVTGAEGIEASLKIARAAAGRKSILYFGNSFHGKTQGALSVTSNPAFRAHLVDELADYPHFEMDSFYYHYNGKVTPDVDAFRRPFEALLEKLREGGVLPAAAVIEPIQAAEGMLEIPVDILACVISSCARFGVISIFDEIYTGLGRTGAPFVCTTDLCPDLVVLGKALGNGMPISAVVGRADLVDVLGYSQHSSTYTFMPLSCAAASKALDIHLTERPWENAARIGSAITSGLTRLASRDERIKDIRSRGLMIAVDVDDGKPGERLSRRIERRLEANGVLVRTGGRDGTTVKATPPLVLDHHQADHFLEAFERSLMSV